MAQELNEFKEIVYAELDELNLPPGYLQFSSHSSPIPCTENDFEKILQLGEGSFGEVYKAKHLSSDQLMAIKYQKIIFDPNSDEAKAIYLRNRLYELLVREIIALRKAESEYIPKYYGMLFTEEKILFCMELLNFNANEFYRTVGQVEKSKNPNAHFDETALAIIGVSVLNALLHLKSQLEVMHRDIKPRNILMDFKGNVKLSDLGLVTFLENSVGISVKSGTKLYCSPEVLDGGLVLKYRVKSDVWSLGITMMEIAFFKFPYVSILEKDFIDEVCDGPAPIMSHDDGYSEEMTEFVNQCLIKEPEARAHIRDLAKTKLAIKFQDLNKTRDYMMKFIQNYTEDIP